MAMVAQPLDDGSNDDRKYNRDDGDDSESDVSSVDEEQPRKKAVFVRCAGCRDKKKACTDCNKRRNCEASERHRKKNKLTAAALKRLKKENCVLKAKLEVYRENDEFVRGLITSGAIYCRGCCGQLVGLPAAHVAPQPPPPSAVQPPWNRATQPLHVMPTYAAHHSQVDHPTPVGSAASPLYGDPVLGAGPLAIDLDDIGFWLNENDGGNGQC